MTLAGLPACAFGAVLGLFVLIGGFEPMIEDCSIASVVLNYVCVFVSSSTTGPPDSEVSRRGGADQAKSFIIILWQASLH